MTLLLPICTAETLDREMLVLSGRKERGVKGSLSVLGSSLIQQTIVILMKCHSTSNRLEEHLLGLENCLWEERLKKGFRLPTCIFKIET